MIQRRLLGRLLGSAAVLAVAVLAVPAGAQEASAPPPTEQAAVTLEDGFREPPNAARPRVWWHWMNGNVSEEGIRADIAWMARVGIGGLQNFDAALNTRTIVDERLVYMTPPWRRAFRVAAEEADRHGLELAIAGSPGWSETGGPWVQPQDAMKRLVWSETIVPGGRRFNGTLAPLPANAGPFQDLHVSRSGLSGLNEALRIADYAQPVAVLAMRLPDGPSLPRPRVISSTGQAFDAAALADARFTGDQPIAPAQGGAAATHLAMTFDAPQTVRSLTLHLAGAQGGPFSAGLAPVLEASEDGTSWRRVADVPLRAVPTTVSFTPATARYFRVTLGRPPAAGGSSPFGSIAPGVDLGGMMGAFGATPAMMAPTPLAVSELSLSGEARIDSFEAKAGFAVASDYYGLADRTGPDDARGVAPADVIDLTSRLGADGRLDWTPPAGRWRILRLGYALIGTTNHPATPEATGLEVDKYDGRAVRRYIDHYFGMYRETTGADLFGRRGLRAFLTDSIEVGASNWTPDMIAQFRRLRGYDPTPWLPTLAGILVGTRAQSDAFLYDFRRTLADLIASEHYGTLATAARDNGLVYYSEALEDGRPTLGDDMAMRARADIPMAAMWTFTPGSAPRQTLIADIRGAASTSHIYGQNLVAAESMTSVMQPWNHAPADLRPVIDLEFVNGVNRPVIHTSVHQPRNDLRPGLALQIFGQYFNRHETWAEMARPWVDYIARSAFMLQQGHAQADVGYVYGEEAPLTGLYQEGQPADAPRAYDYDFVNADALLNQLSNDGVDVVSRGGARYRVLYLGGTSRRMTLPVLRRLAALAEGGATVVGDAPTGSPSLNDDRGEYAGLVARLWSGQPVTTVGRGRVVAGTNVEAALASTGLGPDFRVTGLPSDARIAFAHRRLADGHVYFLVNRDTVARSGEARFRVTGRAPELWRADTGERRPLSYRIVDGETIAPLELAASDSAFIVFRTPTAQAERTVTQPRVAPVADLGADGWTVSFQSGRGAPDGSRTVSLGSLSENGEAGIRYFSGVATYAKAFALPRGARAGRPLLLDLGRFGDVAEVLVNGRQVGTVWHGGQRVDIGSAVRAGTNRIEIRVANLWVNRLIGDAQPGATRIAYTPTPTYTAGAPLRLSGLIGPVTLLAEAADR